MSKHDVTNSCPQCEGYAKRVSRLRRLLDAIMDSEVAVTFCTYCEHEIPGLKRSDIQAHILECPAHPLFKANQEIANLTAALDAVDPMLYIEMNRFIEKNHTEIELRGEIERLNNIMMNRGPDEIPTAPEGE